MKVKVSELTGPALDWAVAKLTNPEWWLDGYMDGDPRAALDMDDGEVYAPSTDWSQGGPIIERECISVDCKFDENAWYAWTPSPEQEDSESYGDGPTPLVAAMRCYVASKLGDEVEVPSELA